MFTMSMCTEWYSECLNVHHGNVYSLHGTMSVSMCTMTMCTDWFSECLNVHHDNVYRLVLWVSQCAPWQCVQAGTLSVSMCTMTMCTDWFSECLNVHHDNVYRLVLWVSQCAPWQLMWQILICICTYWTQLIKKSTQCSHYFSINTHPLETDPLWSAGF